MLDVDEIKRLYPFPPIRCWRIVRDTEREIGDLQLDAETAFELGSNNLGVLAGGCRGTIELIDKFRQLAESDLPGTVVVALYSSVEVFLYRMRLGPPQAEAPDDWWQVGCVMFTTPEKLRRIGPRELDGRPVVAVVLVDPPGILHQARGGAFSTYSNNDRPQHIARFRAAHERAGWRPPFFLFTEKRAMSLSTNHMLGAYSLEGWWFVDGGRLRMGAPPKTRRADADTAGVAPDAATDTR